MTSTQNSLPSYIVKPKNEIVEKPLPLVGDENKYQYNGKELNGDFGLDWMDYGARFYDGSLGRFGTVDRFAEKYSTMSPYLYTLNNPIRFIDINGDSVDVFRPDGSHLYTYDDGKDIISGLYMQNSETRDDNTTIYSNGISFAYNDVVEDRAALFYGDFKAIKVADDNYINSFVDNGIAGMSGSLSNVMEEGLHQGTIDYNSGPNGVPSQTLTIANSTEGGFVAYNVADFANYLTGQTLNRLGYSSIWTAVFGHGNNIINGPTDHGSRDRSGWLDSKADQRALFNGWHHYERQHIPKAIPKGNTPFGF